MIDNDKLKRLIKKGVRIPNPALVDIGTDVDIERISAGATLYPGTRIAGAQTLIMPGAVLGQEGPVIIADCYIGQDVELKGGYFCKSVFLAKAAMGPCAHVRDACLLEEEANGAHTVGLKHTILFPFVTLGSLINFCDCLMSGGTSRKDHSEVGSSYIHFNFTPHQDKATPSLIGDVPRGVMLRERPIFLGGQGGLVGPARIGFGTVTAAGVVLRGDLGDSRLVSSQPEGKELTFFPGVYGEIKRRVANNVNYIANLVALRQWYAHVRTLFLDEKLLHGALNALDTALDERIARLRALATKMPESVKGYKAAMQTGDSEALIKQQAEFHSAWQGIEDTLNSRRSHEGAAGLRDALLEKISRSSGDYISAIKGLNANESMRGTQWLQGIVDDINAAVLNKLPSLR
jgi:UDP-N-acetylglucosamine/UDP-N-acetylgalactosamine diphosphorylase